MSNIKNYCELSETEVNFVQNGFYHYEWCISENYTLGLCICHRYPVSSLDLYPVTHTPLTYPYQSHDSLWHLSFCFASPCTILWKSTERYEYSIYSFVSKNTSNIYSNTFPCSQDHEKYFLDTLSLIKILIKKG